jgi:hypothetical protein
MRRLARPGPLRVRLEVFAWCLTVGFFGWWFIRQTSDLNWMHWSLAKSIILTMPWLWAGVFGTVVWGCWCREISEAQRRIRAACVIGAASGLVTLGAIGVVVRPQFNPLRSTELSRDQELFLSTVVLGAFVFGGATLCVWWKRCAWTVEKRTDPATGDDPEPTRSELQSLPTAAPPAPPAGEALRGR